MTYQIKTLNDDNIIEFVNCTSAIYHNDPFHTKQNVTKIKQLLNNEEFSQSGFMVYDGDKPLGRVLARYQASSDNGFIGLYETINNDECATLLLQHARDWLEKLGAKVIYGPMLGDTWQRYRFNLGPYDEPPFLMEPYNPDYYHDLWLQFGFKLEYQYYSLRVNDIRPNLLKLAKAAEQAEQHGYRTRQFNKKDFKNECRIIYDLSCRIFTDNLLYQEISFEEFFQLYETAKPLLMPQLIHFVLDKDQQPVGFMFAIPDYFKAVKALKCRYSPWHWLKFFYFKMKVDTVNLKSVGVLAEHRRYHLASLLSYRCYQQAFKLKYHKANLCLIKNDNPSGKIDQGDTTVLRRYGLYKLDLV